MRKIIALVLVAMLLIPAVAIAQPQTSEGDDSDTITRAEFSKIVVELGGRLSVSFFPRDTEFVDVTIDHWASGYIHQLAGNIVRGDGDGNFRPDDAILIEEAITMLVRLLGGQSQVIVADGFPYGYIIVADELFGLMEEVDFTSGEYATRDLVQKLVNASLDTPIFFSHAHANAPHGSGAFLADGIGGNPLQTLRTSAWHNSPIYFNGENWVMLESE